MTPNNQLKNKRVMAITDCLRKTTYCLLLILNIPSTARSQAVYECDDHDTSVIGLVYGIDHSPELQLKKGVPAGNYIVKYFGGQKIRFTCCTDGRKYIGLYTEYYQNGSIKHMIFYDSSGIKQGNEYMWHDNGNIYRSMSYVDGKLVKSSYEWNKKSQLIKKTIYEGNKATEVYYKNGREVYKSKEGKD